MTAALKNILRLLDSFGIVRKNNRQPVKLNFTCSDNQDKGGKKSFNGKVVDLSTSDFMTWLPKMKFVRDIMKVQINIPTDGDDFILDAVVEDLWISEVEHTCCFHGFKFIAMDDAKAKSWRTTLPISPKPRPSHSR